MAVILLVEDDDDTREMMAMRLSEVGHKVEIANSAAVAETKLKSEILPELLIVDVNLPGSSGLELLGRLASHDRLRGNIIPAIVVTGNTDVATIERTHALGAVHLSKPVSTAVLIEAINRALSPKS